MGMEVSHRSYHLNSCLRLSSRKTLPVRTISCISVWFTFCSRWSRWSTGC